MRGRWEAAWVRRAGSVVSLCLCVFAATGFALANDSLRVALVTGGCTGCHGTTGEGGQGIPSIAQTKTRAEFIAMMKAFRDNQGNPTVMNRISRGYTDEEFALMAVRFAKPN